MKILILIMTVLVTSQAYAKQAVETLVQNINLLKGSAHPTHESIAQSVYFHAKEKGIDPNLVLAVLMTESTFNQGAVSPTGDYGIGQINIKVWNKEFKRLKLKPLNSERVKADQDYAIKKTVEILAIVKKDSDPYWIGRYHSKTPSLKIGYYNKIRGQLVKMDLKKKQEVQKIQTNWNFFLALNP